MGLTVGDLLGRAGDIYRTIAGQPGAGRVGRRVLNRFLPESPTSTGRPPDRDNPYVPDILEDIYDPIEDVGQNGRATEDCFALPTTLPLEVETRSVPRDGYVTVQCNGVKMQMLKPVARALGKWKPRRKPLISASEARIHRKAVSVDKKILRVAKDLGVRGAHVKKAGGAVMKGSK